MPKNNIREIEISSNLFTDTILTIHSGEAANTTEINGKMKL